MTRLTKFQRDELKLKENARIMAQEKDALAKIRLIVSGWKAERDNAERLRLTHGETDDAPRLSPIHQTGLGIRSPHMATVYRPYPHPQQRQTRQKSGPQAPCG